MYLGKLFKSWAGIVRSRYHYLGILYSCPGVFIILVTSWLWTKTSITFFFICKAIIMQRLNFHLKIVKMSFLFLLLWKSHRQLIPGGLKCNWDLMKMTKMYLAYLRSCFSSSNSMAFLRAASSFLNSVGIGLPSGNIAEKKSTNYDYCNSKYKIPEITDLKNYPFSNGSAIF